jgi:dolichol-phosphate mannosyltransferase
VNKKISIILSTYNEALSVENTINKLRQNIENLELIIVDDNSSDGTLQIIKKYENEDTKIFCRKSTKGLASAFLCGLLYSTGEIIGWIDSNMGDLSVNFPNMEKELKEYDLVLLSRYVDIGNDQRNKVRVFFSILINKLCNIFLTNKIKDFTSSIFLMNKSVLQKVVPISYGHGEFFIEFLYGCYKKDLKIKEIPYTQINDIEGNSKTAPNIFVFIYLGLFYLIRIVTSKIRRD